MTTQTKLYVELAKACGAYHRCVASGNILMARTEERIPEWLISALAQLRAAKKTIDNNL